MYAAPCAPTDRRLVSIRNFVFLFRLPYFLYFILSDCDLGKALRFHFRDVDKITVASQTMMTLSWDPLSRILTILFFSALLLYCKSNIPARATASHSIKWDISLLGKASVTYTILHLSPAMESILWPLPSRSSHRSLHVNGFPAPLTFIAPFLHHGTAHVSTLIFVFKPGN
jgi:hypothetical protein